ncbi:fumarylacetoacetate hydrolase family protein [Rhizobium sp. YJ-22]|uniref:fumarylacetoacetate hydrolase family protein n=1 Tax=Rhizobium sp. YJ-22 TaxID=3037556 RepID=UPI00241260E0|nr:fumarylacetoacetate hydrolase family protein [Rhizobium sp. YJ-22]MDG3579030.1 fumarylacetoacetate hydrolase family protein [Rhizobium sp. YJ-22]
MKFSSYRRNGRASYGVVADDGTVDIPDLFSAIGKSALAHDLLSFIEAGSAAVAALEDALAEAVRSGRMAVVPPAEISPLTPLPRPPKMICVGRNYAEHAREAGFEMSSIPIIFPKFSSVLVADGDAILLPKVSEQLDWEGELAVVMGPTPKGQIARADALTYVFGYTVFNDVTIRDYQFRTTQYTAGKNFRTSGPVGPWIVTADEIADPHALRIRTWLNGTVMQDANTAEMFFDVPTIIEHLSEFIDLEAGDIIAMGTPAGVGFKRKPPIFMRHGDVVTVEIESIGRLENRVVGEG